MDEAIDYNALGWVRQELDETLKLARVQLEEYAAGAENKTLLQKCAAQLHEALGPLQMVGIKGAVLLTSEMEEVIADLLQDAVEEKETALELLMQAFLQLPDYLSSIRSGRKDNPAVMLPVINSLRATRGEQPLQETAVFSPNLSTRVPATVFDVRAHKQQQDVPALARAARVRFQGGLLSWYRGGDGMPALQTLIDVLVHLQECALSEPVARVWWIGAGIAEALRDGELEETTEIKQLFGQLDRQIKRLMDSGEKVFSDLLTDDLVKNLLYRLTQCDSRSHRIVEIKSTYGLNSESADGEGDAPSSEGMIVFNDDLLQTVAVTVRTDIEDIKEQIEAYTRSGGSDKQVLAPVSDGLHMLGNTLDMISKEALSNAVFGHELALREFLAGNDDNVDSMFSAIANTLFAIDGAIDDVAANDSENAALTQGIEAVTREVIVCMARAKEVLNEFLKGSGDFEALGEIPDLLGKMAGGLQLINEERAAVVTRKICLFVQKELIDKRKTLSEAQLDSLADAVCSVEFHVEETCESRGNTGAALEISELALKKLGYPCPVFEPPVSEEPVSNAATQAVEEHAPVSDVYSSPPEIVLPAEMPVASVTGVADNAPDIVAMQVIAADVDEEILSIFLEEADEELVKLNALLPAWVSCPDLEDYLVDARRSFHTLKGSGRMVGALAAGELAWAFESLANRIAEGAVTPHDDIRELLSRAPGALSALVGQIRGEAIDADMDINHLAHCALVYCDPEGVPEIPLSVQEADQNTVDESVAVEAATFEQLEIVEEDAPVEAKLAEQEQLIELPVLSAEADPEIVEIFLEEAAEELASIAAAIPEWVSQPDNEDALGTVRRSMHTLKGSGRMAGAMLVGEFSWSIEVLLNRVIEGAVTTGEQLFELLGQVPEALSQLIRQVQDGSSPEVDFSLLMQQAETLARGEIIETVAAAEEVASEELADTEVMVDAGEEDDDAVLIDIFKNECNGHLQVMQEYLAGGDEPRVVSEPLYRALHTLSGISESAEVISIRSLASDLNVYVDEVFHAGLVLDQGALGVLHECSAELGQLIGKLPDQAFDETSQAALRERIAALPRVVEEAVEEQLDAGADTSAEQLPDEVIAVPEQQASAEGNPYAEMDQELYEIFVEEASELIENSEAALRLWSQQPDGEEHRSEFQRHIHTLKGSARMMDIMPVGDLAHVLESLMTQVTDGQIAASDDLFTLLHESHDRLSEMVENIKALKLPGDSTAVEVSLQAMVQQQDGTETVIDVVEEPQATDGVESFVEGVAESVSSDVQAEPETDVVTEAVTEAVAVADDESSAGSEPEVTTVAEEPAAAAVDESGQHDDIETAKALKKAPVIPVKAERRTTQKVRSEQVRVQSELLDDMVNHAGEISIYRTRMEQQVSDYRFNLTELDQTITRLRNQLRQLEMETEAQILFRHEQEVEVNNPEFDPLEMDRYSNLQQTSRSLIESISDLRSLQEIMDHTTREAETLLLQQSRVNADLQEGLMRTRMIPFSGLASRLRRIVRQSSSQLGKKVELDLVGADGEMDRTVIDRIIAPLEHMLRNAIAHGIESPAQRSESGKQETGSITISFDREGPEIVLRIEDDGAGIDIDAVRARAVERGLLQTDSALADIDVMQFILQSGFSTTTEVTQISGRGVGMDVVNSEVRQLGGSLHMASTAGAGTLFTVRLPYTLAINHALLVTAGEQPFCVPLGSVEGIVRANPEELMNAYGSEECVYEYAGNEYQLRHLGTLLETGNIDLSQSQGQVPVLLVRIGEKRLAFQVESLMGSREIVIKPVGVQLSTVNSVSGATILGDGSVVMILDMAAIARINTRMQPLDLPARKKIENQLLVMVVDDSITVRKVTTRLLERNGFKVLTAKDGIDALGQLQESVPDMMLLDIEMPRMDGFELATHVRSDAQLKHVPIIMITSRTGDKHRERAREIGVNNYLGKPYQENELLDSIHRIIGVSEAGAVA
jgi:chemosensory pili system protein ChpA (sensor histidine kinase/response regulator)